MLNSSLFIGSFLPSRKATERVLNTQFTKLRVLHWRSGWCYRQKYPESLEMWCWSRMKKISLTDSVRYEEVLLLQTGWRSCDLDLDEFLTTNQLNASSFSNLFRNKTLHVSDSSSVHHQEFFTGWNCSFILILLTKLSANLYNISHCCVYSEKLLMVDRETVRNM
jgi:hypothetical protein